MSPVNGTLPYVYDKLLSWPGCSGGTLVDWVSRNGTNATASNATSSSSGAVSQPKMKSSSSSTEAAHSPSGVRRR